MASSGRAAKDEKASIVSTDIDTLHYRPRLVSRSSSQKTLELVKSEVLEKLDLLKKSPHSIDPAALDKFYNTVENLSLFDIPQLDGESKQYCSLAASHVGGVTAKVSLVSFFTIMEKLTHFLATDTIVNLDDFMLLPEAILKLPKHKKILEVQREAIALNISRILGLKTTKSVMVLYNGEPALFIPFEKIDLLSEFAEGKEVAARLSLKRKIYINNSIIKSIGEGLQPDLCIDDFGKALALLYLCNDPDALGGYNQNKALIDSHSLFIFDQVVQSTQSLEIDSRVSLAPYSFLSGKSRHTEGRNKTLIEDSSLYEKLNSIMMLLAKKNAVLSMLDQIIKNHTDDRPGTRELALQVSSMRNDAVFLKKIIEDRINQVFKHFPRLLRNKQVVSFSSDEQSETEKEHYIEMIKRALVLEQLINHPQLFTNDGRAYKNLWTDRHTNKILQIQYTEEAKIDEDDYVDVSHENSKSVVIKSSLPMDIAFLSHFLSRANIIGAVFGKNKLTLQIPLDSYMKINETIFFPESKNQFDPTLTYLVADELKTLGTTYTKGYLALIVPLIDTYKKQLASPTISTADKLEHAKNAISQVSRRIKEVTDKGFLLHVLKKLQFDVQKELQKIIVKEFKEQGKSAETDIVLHQMTHAFNAAIKLDRVGIFNKVVMSMIANKADAASYKKYFRQCIEFGTDATNYDLAWNNSDALQKQSDTLLKQYRKKAIAKREPVSGLSIFVPAKDKIEDDRTPKTSSPSSSSRESDSPPESETTEPDARPKHRG